MRADLLLELADLLAERRLGHVQPLRRAAEVQLLGDGDEVAKVSELHATAMMVGAWTSSTHATGMIRLGQLLKAAGLVDTGGEAKLLLADEQVTVNGEVETRRGRQLHPGDVVALGDASVRLT